MKIIYISVLALSSFLLGCNLLPFGQKKENNDMLLAALGILALNASDWVWDLPPGFPTPVVPAENPMSRAKVELGRHLFYEKRLSGNVTMSCGSCHFQSLAFADGKEFPSGITGDFHPRNAQHLGNVAYLPRLTWNNPNMTSLEVQARVPMFGDNPVELGLGQVSEAVYFGRLKSDPLYVSLFTNAYGNGDAAVNEQNIRFAIASFQRSMITGWSNFDKIQNRRAVNLSSEQIASINRGNDFFNGENAECFHCHGGFNFTDTNLHTGQVTSEFAYHNNGTHTEAYYNSLNNVHKEGLKELTGLQSDQGKFKAPSLRNVGLTFPYMHDGSIQCDNAENPANTPGKTNADCARHALGKVLDQYSTGGAAHPNKDATLIRAFPQGMSPTERADMINFLMALTDEEFVNSPKFANPF
ncbi:di-heme enzyme [Leptospira sp. 96542]|nr:di-heme enzyme [Leptospira sp. 96542]